jgi:fimbrial chaperone protein
MKIKYNLLLSNHYFNKIVFSSLLLVSFFPEINAFELSPAVTTLEPTGIKATQVYLLTNSNKEPAAIQFNVTTRQQRSNGSEIRNSANDLFTIHPAQVVIPAGGTQKIRLKWLGNKKVTREQAYRFIAQQLPINLSKKKGANMNLVMKFEASLYVKPKNNSHNNLNNKTATQVSVIQPNNNKLVNLTIAAVQVVNTPQGKQLLLRVSNPSNEHIILDNATVQVSSGIRNIKLNGKQLGNMSGQNLLARATRNFTMPIPSSFVQQQKWTGKFIN